ncbi:MAG TPA: Lrp/AsnC family transcriptional regulator [Aggregatilineales bacterium]|nr:Lrp/AsnC family transcriptional regulator [Anaerolineae bacterium]HUN07815.1 Lrp/AsnC family transcriptional regulator [Aggregatilineales bacterium]
MKKEPITGLDDLDLDLLRHLQVDSSISKADLGRLLNLSQPAVHHRIRRLEDRGYIQRYVALLDRELLGLDLLCFVQVSVQKHHRDHIVAFEQAVQAMPEVLDCHHLTGEFDFLLKVVVTHRKALETLLVERLSTLPGVTRLQTSVVLSEVKHVTAFPLE